MPIFLLSLLILSCHFPNPASKHAQKAVIPSATALASITTEPIAYPIWFLNPPTGLNFRTAVGYSPTYLDSDASIEAATQDGIEQLTKSISVQIRGEVRTIGDYQKQYFQEIVPDSVKETVADKSKILATHIGPKMTIVLLGLAEGNLINQETVMLQSLPTPSWIKEVPRQKGYFYGSGHCGKRYYEESGWRTAEEDARIHLALNFQSYVNVLVKHFNSQVETISITETDVILNRIEVVGRWFDIKTKTYHVLVRAPLSQNADAVRSELNQLDNVSPPSREKIIRRAFDELEEEVR